MFFYDWTSSYNSETIEYFLGQNMYCLTCPQPILTVDPIPTHYFAVSGFKPKTLLLLF